MEVLIPFCRGSCPFLIPGLARCPAVGSQFRCLCGHLRSLWPGGGLGEQVLWWRCWKSAGDDFFLKKKPAVNAIMEFGVWWPESFTEGCQRLEYLSYIALKIVL